MTQQNTPTVPDEREAIARIISGAAADAAMIWESSSGGDDHSVFDAAADAIIALRPNAAIAASAREALEIAADALNGCEYATSGDTARAGAALVVVRKALSKPEGVRSDLVVRLRGHSLSLLELAKYPAEAHALTNADAVSYGELLGEAATALAALSSNVEGDEG